MAEINLYVEPDAYPQIWDEFVVHKGPFSVALDGYVQSPTQYDESGPRMNFNHHDGVDRATTASTCLQVLNAIRGGFFQRFRENGLQRADVYVNDCDQDVCTAYYLLTHAPLVENSSNPLINKLVEVENKLDVTSGAYPFHPDLEILRNIAWIFEPYTSFRMSSDFDAKSPQQNEEVIKDCAHRIQEYMMGRAKEIPLDVRFEVLDQRPGYTVVKEIGQQARLGMFGSGINAFLSVRETERSGFWRYVVGRRSEFIPFSTKDIFGVLNGVDPIVSGTNRWGGGNMVGGSPFVTGSKLAPQQVVGHMDNALLAHPLG